MRRLRESASCFLYHLRSEVRESEVRESEHSVALRGRSRYSYANHGQQNLLGSGDAGTEKLGFGRVPRRSMCVIFVIIIIIVIIVQMATFLLAKK